MIRWGERVLTASPACDPTPLGSRWLSRGRRVCEGASLLTPFVAIAALWTSIHQLGEARRSAKVKPIGDIIAQSTSITMWMASYPEVAPYFQADVFGPGRTAEDDRKLLEGLARAEPGTRRRVQSVCEVIADFFETTYTGRASFDPDDWAARWAYMRDVHDESPVLRAYFARRDRWYTVDEALRPARASVEAGIRRR